jgi:ABC-2 type transport system ATP-binding protein
MPAIVVDKLGKSFDGVRAVGPLSFVVEEGEMFALVGPDGAGKTTTIRMLCGILSPDAGTLQVGGMDAVQAREEVRRRIGYLSQRFTLYGDLTVDENIEFFAEIHGVRDFRKRREDLLAFTRLLPFRERLAGKLSGGMKQKLALACILIHQPAILILDEPTTGVDPVSRREFWKILQNLLGTGMTILMTTPYLDEADRCTRVALMNKGILMDVDTPMMLRKHVRASVLEIVCDQVRRAVDVVGGIGGFPGTQAFGDRIHVLVRDETAGAALVRERLAEAGINVSAIRTVKPSLENVFIALLSSNEAKEVSL